MTTPLPSLDFIAGLVVKEGSFLWVKQKQYLIPVFQIKVPLKEITLLELIKEKLSLSENIHKYNYKDKTFGLLLVRKRSSIENIIIPVFDGRLFGTKKTQFESWKDLYYQRKLNFLYKKSNNLA